MGNKLLTWLAHALNKLQLPPLQPHLENQCHTQEPLQLTGGNWLLRDRIEHILPSIACTNLSTKAFKAVSKRRQTLQRGKQTHGDQAASPRQANNKSNSAWAVPKSYRITHPLTKYGQILTLLLLLMETTHKVLLPTSDTAHHTTCPLH